MSQENVELARRGYEAFARRDLDAVFELFDPEIEAHDPPEMPDAAVHRGHDAVRRDWQQTYELFEDFTIESTETIDAGDEVFAGIVQRGRPHGSRAVVEERSWQVVTFCDGVATRVEAFLERAQALKAVGLSE